MEILSFFSAALVSFFLLTFLFKHLLLNPPKTPPPPPSPPFSLPILGHLHLLKKPLHRWLSHLSNRYGPILLLQFGSRTVLVVSSPSALQQCFTNNDIILANRPRLLAGKYLGYNYSNLPWSSYGNSWRNLRRVTTIEIFSSNRINASSAVRNEEVRSLVRKLCGGGGRDVGFRKVELRQVLFELVLNVMMRIAAGKRYYGGGEEQKADSGEARKFQEIVEESFLVSAATNFLDFLPVLRWVGFGGGEKRIEELQKKRNEFLQGLVDERRRTKSCSDIIVGEGEGEGEGEEKKEKILLDALLGLQESDPDYYTDEILKGILVIMFTAGTDTTTLTMEWAMSLLLNHPEVLTKARREIESHVKQCGRLLEESDLPNLPYLHCIINETMRLYPVGPVLVPHESSEECTVGGFSVPRGTMLLPNVWAVQRDPNAWEEPTLFLPERFEGVNLKEDSYNYKFLPFGLGRRSCPGAAMATRFMGLALGVLIQCFEWERVGPEEIGMDEVPTGLTLRKAKPLDAMYKPRESMMDVLSQL